MGCARTRQSARHLSHLARLHSGEGCEQGRYERLLSVVGYHILTSTAAVHTLPPCARVALPARASSAIPSPHEQAAEKARYRPPRRPNAPTIHVRGAREHNLKNVDLEIPRDALIVFTGLSGSGKSSLAFDTIYAEGQRRYVESLSAYARQFLEMMQKPDVDHIDGLSPAISIEQKTTSRNPRSTVGTVTEIYDYLRLLFARVGVPYSPATGLPIESQTVTQMVDRVLALPEGTRALPAGAGRARPQGRVPQGAGRVAEEGLPARQDQRHSSTRSPTRRSSTRNSSTTSTWWSTASSCAPTSPPASPTASRRR